MKEIILKADGSLYKEVDYIDYLRLRLAICKGEITEPLFIQNEYGGSEQFDKFGCTHYNAFGVVNDLLKEIIYAQCDIRKEDLNAKQK